MFATRLPSFNINGKEEIRTSLGGLLSLVIYTMTFLYSLMKIQHLFLRKNPAITTFTDPNAFGPEERFSTGIDGFQIAIAADHFSEGVRKDPRYLQFIARLYLDTRGTVTSKYFRMYPCTEEDFEKFYPVEKRSKSMLDNYRKDGGLHCIDWQNADMEVFGSWRFDAIYQAVDIFLAPCGMSYTLHDGTEYKKDESECEWDKDKFIDYLGDTFYIKFFYNHQSFQQASFLQDNRVIKSSKMGQILTKARDAIFVDTHINLHELIDEIDLIQIGQ